MSKWVLDASAVLAVIFGEPGHEMAKSRFSESIISSVNVAEILSTLADRSRVIDEDIRQFTQLRLSIIDFDYAQAKKAAELRPLTRKYGLSLGDRCCLALAMTRNVTAVTADRDWKKLAFCKVETIR